MQWVDIRSLAKEAEIGSKITVKRKDKIILRKKFKF